jgi:ELWxxDGT repeat protein
VESLEARNLLAGQPFLVKDINLATPDAVDGYQPRITDVAGTLYFAADDGVHGTELWKSEGTPGGATLVADIHPTGASKPVVIGALGNRVVFSATRPGEGRELWISDGTTSGTMLVKDIHAGVSSGMGQYPNLLEGLNVELEGALLFAANDGTSGIELWRTDGTDAGTYQVRDIATGASSSEPTDFFRLGSQVLFSARVAGQGRELWSTDGTEAGTVLVKDINPGGGAGIGETSVYFGLSDERPFFAELNGIVYFAGEDGATGQELWRTDGTAAGTYLVKDAAPGSDWGIASNESVFSIVPSMFDPRVVASGQRLFFFNGADSSLWTSDGTEAGTVPFVQLENPFAGAFWMGMLGDDLLYLSGSSSELDRVSLWRSDGTVAGTEELTPGGLSLDFAIPKLVFWEDHVYFAQASSQRANQLWRSDGTIAGTTLVKEIEGSFSFSGLEFASATSHGVVFHSNSAEHGFEPYVSDGTAAGTYLLGPVRTVDSVESDPGERGSPGKVGFVEVDGWIYFTANDHIHGTELWKTDGTFAGTQLVKDITPGPLSSNVRLKAAGGIIFLSFAETGELWRSDGTEAGTYRLLESEGISPVVPFGEKVLFRAVTAAEGSELWVSDGTIAGTFLLANINPGAANAMSPGLDPPLPIAGGYAYFVADDGVHGRELWRTNGTSAGTQLVMDINPGGAPSSVTSMFAVGNALAFQANDGVHGSELWATDGAQIGMIKDIRPGISSSTISPLRALDGKLLFATDDGVHGTELWISDGTSAGTFMLVDALSGSGAGVQFGMFVSLGNQVIYQGISAAGGRELWVTDGTQVGTFALGDFTPGTANSGFNALGVIGEIAYFSKIGSGGIHSLWRSDGTSAGTYHIVDLPVTNAAPSGVVMDGLLYIRLRYPDHSAELWRSDGTAAGTYLLLDPPHGGLGASFELLTPTSLGLFMQVDDGIHGHELWRLIPESQNQAPEVAIAAPAITVRQMPTTITLTASDEPDDVLFDWSIDWNGDGVVDQTVTGPSGMQISHEFQSAGIHQVKVTASDHLGATSALASVNVDVRVWAVQGDPQVSGKTNLLYGGTSGDDVLVLFGTAGSALAYFISDFGNVQYLTGFNGDFIAYGGAGNDQILAQYASPVILYGGEGDDMLAGGSSNDLLDGGAGDDILLGWHGNDTLLGGDGRDLLLAGGGADLLDGGAGDDLLLSSYLLWGDVLSSFSPTALESIRAEWTSQRSYSERVANLSGNGTGSRNNGDFFLLPSLTTAVDTSVDELIGGDDDDWFLYANPSHSPSDELTDDEPGEFKTDLGALPG